MPPKIAVMKPRVRVTDTRHVRVDPKRADPELLTSGHRAWASEVVRRAGYQCEAIEDGRRCAVRRPARLFADHIVERRDGGAPLDLANGRCLCSRHHVLKTVRERARRMAERY